MKVMVVGNGDGDGDDAILQYRWLLSIVARCFVISSKMDLDLPERACSSIGRFESRIHIRETSRILDRCLFTKTHSPFTPTDQYTIAVRVTNL